MLEFTDLKKVIMFGRFDVAFCDLHLSDSETVLLECESLQTSPVLRYRLQHSLGWAASWSWNQRPLVRRELKGHYYFLNAILLKVIETDFRI